MWNKSNIMSVSPSNPNSMWFGYDKHVFASHAKKIATNLIKSTNMHLKHPYTSKPDLQQIARHLKIKDYKKLSQKELLIHL